MGATSISCWFYIEYQRRDSGIHPNIWIPGYSIHPEFNPPFAMTTMFHRKKIYPMSSRPFNVFVCPLGPLRGAFDRPPQTLRHIGKPPANANLCSGISTREKHIESTMAKLLCPSLCRPSAISHHVFIKHKASTTAKTQTWTRWGNTNRCSVVPLEQFYIVVPLHPLLPCLSSKSSNKSMEVLRYFFNIFRGSMLM